MKAGLAAGLAVCAAFAESTNAAGNLLFIAVPDEENNSAGARKATQALPAIAGERGLDILAAINLDAIADDGDGSKGRVIALVPGTPPSLLNIRDGKSGYDVTTPATAFASFNVLSYRRRPDEVLDRFDRLCADAVSACLAELKQRRHSQHGSAAIDLVETIPLHRYEALLDRLDAEARSRLGTVGASLAAGDLPLPEQCRLVTEEAWRLSRLPGPAIVTGFGSIPYLPTNLSDRPAAAGCARLPRTSQPAQTPAIARRSAVRITSPASRI
ncbi:M20/M25/M40 family metallo-hydrolase [Mesorhizobium sp. M0306]|uniref:M20/M25/M40 family metallo-hydrolase n=1 Tax=unclassified Mesorhizobium TaxID=325217 RepID=UPI0033388685